jgi:hypothetical protein
MKVADIAQFVISKNAGEVFEFNVYHLCRVDDPCALFPSPRSKSSAGVSS